MKNFMFIILSCLSLLGAWFTYSNLTGKLSITIIFACGFLLGVCLMYLIINVKNNKINSYKRELEKESISATENSSRVKVLESKIEVLEKALENALKK